MSDKKSKKKAKSEPLPGMLAQVALVESKNGTQLVLCFNMNELLKTIMKDVAQNEALKINAPITVTAYPAGFKKNKKK